MTDLEKLRELAESATPGKWVWHGLAEPNCVTLEGNGRTVMNTTLLTADHATDAEFVAAANPATMLTLLDRLEAAERERDEARRDLADRNRQNILYFDRAEAAEAKIARIKEAVSGHPECDRYDEGDVISCGWKSAFASVVRALQESEGE